MKKNKTIGILQPGYLPWLGFFEQLWRSDIFVLYDDVQFDKNGWRNRNRIKSPWGILWLSVPVITSGRSKQLVLDVEIDNRTNWQRKHLKSLEGSYSKTPYFKNYYPSLAEVIDRPWKSLLELDMELLKILSESLGICRKMKRSSELKIQGDRLERLAAICKHFGANLFYEGEAGADYIDLAYFGKQGIQVEFQQYQHPMYVQQHGPFISHLSIVDLLFNEGPKSLSLLTSHEQK